MNEAKAAWFSFGFLLRRAAAVTLDVYADLFDDDIDAVADALDHAKTASIEAKPRPRGEFGD